MRSYLDDILALSYSYLEQSPPKQKIYLKYMIQIDT